MTYLAYDYLEKRDSIFLKITIGARNNHYWIQKEMGFDIAELTRTIALRRRYGRTVVSDDMIGHRIILENRDRFFP